jgi:hypothetical protein
MEITVLGDMEKMNGDHFSLWKSQMEDILILRDQYFSIEGVAKKSSLMTNNKVIDLTRIVTSKQEL